MRLRLPSVPITVIFPPQTALELILRGATSAPNVTDEPVSPVTDPESAESGNGRTMDVVAHRGIGEHRATELVGNRLLARLRL